MVRTIHLLPDLTINQIAAGEVIEHPASVVKELVENAVDAGASTITVETLAGGLQWIRVSDNGSGMSPEDAALCLERHATSKISESQDLCSLQTMGFRGEALASIASISKMTLLTATSQGISTRVTVEGGQILCIEPSARAEGTTIEVRSLFYNVPARRKFQKSPSACSAEITKMMTQLALAHPLVGFTLIQQDRSLFSTSSTHSDNRLQSLKDKAKALLNADFVPSCKDFHLQEECCQGIGLIGDPLYARSNRSGQYLFINHRPVYCPSLCFAIKNAYGTRLSTDKHPIYLLHFSIPPHLIDVNVHPQKKEVRLRDENLLKYVVQGAIDRALEGTSLPTSPSPCFFFSDPTPFSSASALSEMDKALLLKEEERTTSEIHFDLRPLFSLIGLYQDYALVDVCHLPSTLSLKPQEGIAVFHLKAAQKRIFFEQLLKQAETTPISQGLLFPSSFHCSLAEAELLQTKQPLLQKMGFCIERAGKTTFLINAIPPLLEESAVQETLQDMLSSQKSESHCDLKQAALLLSRKMHAPAKLYTMEEARHIIENLLTTTHPEQCPEGKPIIHYIKKGDLENRFKTTLTSSY